jgi:hypothetical protein
MARSLEARGHALDTFKVKVARRWNWRRLWWLPRVVTVRADARDVTNLWLKEASEIIKPRERDQQFPTTSHHDDWVAIAALLRDGGEGMTVTPGVLLGCTAKRDGGGLAAQNLLGIPLEIACTQWKSLGAIDSQDRLTSLGSWGVPMSMLNAWFPRPVESSDARAWREMAEAIASLIDCGDFLMRHGADTDSYLKAALSQMIKKIDGPPVVLLQPGINPDRASPRGNLNGGADAGDHQAP